MNIQFAGRHVFKTMEGTAAALSKQDEQRRDQLMRDNSGWQQILNQQVKGQRSHVLLTNEGAPAARALIMTRLGLHAGLETNPDQAKRDRAIMEALLARLPKRQLDAMSRTIVGVWDSAVEFAKKQQEAQAKASTAQ